jgi:hypothetical protein
MGPERLGLETVHMPLLTASPSVWSQRVPTVSSSFAAELRMDLAAAARALSSSTHILARDGAPAPKQPQSSVRPRSSANDSAVKHTTEMTTTASARTCLVGDQSNRSAHAISNGGILNAG